MLTTFKSIYFSLIRVSLLIFIALTVSSYNWVRIHLNSFSAMWAYRFPPHTIICFKLPLGASFDNPKFKWCFLVIWTTAQQCAKCVSQPLVSGEVYHIYKLLWSFQLVSSVSPGDKTLFTQWRFWLRFSNLNDSLSKTFMQSVVLKLFHLYIAVNIWKLSR